MKQIRSIRLVNYKAFYDSQTIEIPNGKNVLIYGENGSGKTSLFEALHQFFNSSFVDSDELPARHIKVPKSYIENEGTDERIEKQSEVGVHVTFTNEDGSNPEEKSFGSLITNTNTDYIRKAAGLGGFLSYRELLKTYLMDNLRNREEFRQKFATLLIEGILARRENSKTQAEYIADWNKMFIPKARNKKEFMKQFKQGFELEIININLIINSVLNYFDPDLKVQLVISELEAKYYHNAKMQRIGWQPYCEIDLEVKLKDEVVDNEEENHLTVLNEARLSAVAISIYLSSIINIPQNDFEYKILFLDDIFIGLDMGNRIPLLEIITQYKRPLIDKEVDDVTGKIIYKLIEDAGKIITEENLFFKDYQIFISTYDRYWFQVAKDFLYIQAKDNWNCLELYAHKNMDIDLNVPLIFTSLDYLGKANYYLTQGHDYPACANYLRKALEKILKEILPVHEHYITNEDKETGIVEVKKINSLHQYIDKFIAYCNSINICNEEYYELKRLKDWYLNPFSHDNISTPMYKRELERAKLLIEDLHSFSINIIIPAGTCIYFEFSHNRATRRYEVELQENLRYICSKRNKILTNPGTKCIKWIKDGAEQDVSKWKDSKLKSFYKNKKNAFYENKEDFEDDFLIENLFIIETSNSISSLI